MKTDTSTIDRAYSLLTVKAVQEDQRVIVGIASTSTPDRMGDIVEPNGAQYKLPIPLLWQHDRSAPIGEVISARVTKAGIEISAKIASVPEEGKLKDRLDEAWHSIKTGLVKGLSIGFRALGEPVFLDGGGIRFKSWEWLELSAVTIPANADATIEMVKRYDVGLPGFITNSPKAKAKKPIVVKLDDHQSVEFNPDVPWLFPDGIELRDKAKVAYFAMHPDWPAYRASHFNLAKAYCASAHLDHPGALDGVIVNWFEAECKKQFEKDRQNKVAPKSKPAAKAVSKNNSKPSCWVVLGPDGKIGISRPLYKALTIATKAARKGSHEDLVAALAKRDARIAELEKRLAAFEAKGVPSYEGVWVKGGKYQRGALVTFGGSLWACQKAGARDKPGTTADWQLAVKRGRDGRDFRG